MLPTPAGDLAWNGDWRLMDVDPVTGKETWVLDEGTRIHFREVMPVGALLEENAALQVDNLNRPFGDMALVARVPMHIWQKRLAPAILQQDRAFIARWLNDGDHGRFRTRAGHI